MGGGTRELLNLCRYFEGVCARVNQYILSCAI